MIVSEFLIMLISLPSVLLSNIIFVRQSFKSPIHETKILAFGFLLISFGLLAFFGSTIIFSPNQTNQLGIDLYKLGSLFFLIGQGFVIATFILPSFSVNYTSIIIISSTFTLYFSVGIFNAMTIDIMVRNDIIIIKQHPLAILGMTVILLFVSAVLKIRYDTIKAAIRQSNTFGKELISTKFYIIFFLLILVLFIVAISRSIPGSPIPQYATLFGLLVSVIFFYLAINFRKIKIWFVTSSNLTAVIIADKNSGIEIYSQMYTELENKEILSSYFKAMNITTQQFIQSKKPLEVIAFADKVILTFQGKFVVTFLIVSEWNLIAFSITKYLTKEFEKQFSDQLKVIVEKNLFNKSDFRAFDSEIKEIRNYLPI